MISFWPLRIPHCPAWFLLTSLMSLAPRLVPLSIPATARDISVPELSSHPDISVNFPRKARGEMISSILCHINLASIFTSTFIINTNHGHG
jgi:hypothetical protein